MVSVALGILSSFEFKEHEFIVPLKKKRGVVLALGLATTEAKDQPVLDVGGF